MSKLVKLLSFSNPNVLYLDHFPYWLSLPRGTNKDPSVWQDGARPPTKNVLKNKMSLTN